MKQLAEEREKERRALSDQVNALQAVVDGFQTKEDEMKAELAALRSRHEETTSGLGKVVNEIHLIEDDMTEATRRLTQDLAELLSMAESEKKLHDEIARLRGDVTSLEGQLGQRDAEMKEVETRLQVYQGELREKQQVIDELEDNHKKLCEELKEIEAASLQASESMDRIDDQTEDIHTRLESFRVYVRGLTDRISHIDELTEGISHIFDSAQDCFESQSSEMNRMRQRVLSLEQEKEEMEHRYMLEQEASKVSMQDASTQSDTEAQTGENGRTTGEGNETIEDVQSSDDMEGRQDDGAELQQLIHDMLHAHEQDMSEMSELAIGNLEGYSERLQAVEGKIQLAMKAAALRQRVRQQREVQVDDQETEEEQAAQEEQAAGRIQGKRVDAARVQVEEEQVRGTAEELPSMQPQQLSHLMTRFAALKDDFDKSYLALSGETSPSNSSLSLKEDEDEAKDHLKLLAQVLDSLQLLFTSAASADLSASTLEQSTGPIVAHADTAGLEVASTTSLSSMQLSSTFSSTDLSKTAHVASERLQETMTESWNLESKKKYAESPMQSRQERRQDLHAASSSPSDHERPSGRAEQVETSFAESKASMAKTQERKDRRVSFSTSPEPPAKSVKKQQQPEGVGEDFPSVPFSYEVDLLLLHRQQQLKALSRAFAAEHFNSSMKPGKVLRSLESEHADKTQRKHVKVLERPGNARASAASFINSVSGPDAVKLPILQAPTIPSKTSHVREEELVGLLSLRRDLQRRISMR